MKITQLDHFNLVAPKDIIKKVEQFYIDILGFRIGFRPDFGIDGSWLYLEDKPLIHLTVVPDSNQPNNYGRGDNTGSTAVSPFHHVALSCEGLEEYKKMLEARQVPFMLELIPQLNMTQIFIHDPAGACIELNFKEI